MSEDRPSNVVEGIFASRNIGMTDIQEYWQVVNKAFLIHDDREAIRHGLWKKYSALDQMRQVKIKAERVIHTLEDRGDPLLVLPELPDIINYSIFGHRILEGKF